MKMVETLTSKKGVVVYFSATGNTKAFVDMFSPKLFDIVPVKQIDMIDISDYDLILVGMSTWRRGMPPKPFIDKVETFRKIKDKKIGLFGSGHTQYEYFCGSLDLYEQILQVENTILFKYKYEGYPTESNFEEMKILIKQMEELL